MLLPTVLERQRAETVGPFQYSMVRPGGVYLRRLDLEGFQTVNTACLCYMLVVALSELL